MQGFIYIIITHMDFDYWGVGGGRKMWRQKASIFYILFDIFTHEVIYFPLKISNFPQFNEKPLEKNIYTPEK